MPTLQTLRRRIETTDELHSVVRTMKGLAAVNIRQFERAVASLRDYTTAVELGLTAVLRTVPELLHVNERMPGGIAAFLLFGSDQGLCGPLNNRMVRHLRHAAERHNADLAGSPLAVVGRRAAGELAAAGLRPTDVFDATATVDTIAGNVQQVLATVSEWHRDPDIDRVILVHPSPARGTTFEPRTVRLLPIDAVWLATLRDRPWPTAMLPMTHGEPRDVFTALLEDHFFIVLYRAFAETLASENASRLAAMQAAQNNIEERQDQLAAAYRQQRQQQITEELLDVMAGFEALQT